MFTPQAIGFVESPYKEPAAIPKGLAQKHDAEGILRILPEFGLTDIEGFSHVPISRSQNATGRLRGWPPCLHIPQFHKLRIIMLRVSRLERVSLGPFAKALGMEVLTDSCVRMTEKLRRSCS
jgi:hypothetical protein